ncbi:MAG: MATE family efflux transporter [Planctomycetes bacterium]|nr:MATE family efflux transporter [Planctomycetota bacterium]
MSDVINEAAAAGVAPTEVRPRATRDILLTGSVGAALAWLALPVLGEQVLHLLVGLVDTYLAGTVNKEATAAIGLATTVVWLAHLMFSFVGAGAAALVSRHAGMNETDRANHFSNQAIALALLMGLLECVLLWLAAPLLPWWLGWEPEPTRIAVQFLRIDCWGYVIYSLTLIGGACWRGMGDTRTPLYVMCFVNVWNVVASTSLRFGLGPAPNLGVLGIPLGTLSARVLGGLIVLVLLVRGRSGLRLGLRAMRYRWTPVARLLRVGIPAGIDGLLMWTGHFLFLRIISGLRTGDEQAAIVAAHFVGIRVEALSYMPAFAWATAAATLVGQSLGAADPRRAMRSGHLAALQGSALCFVMGVLYFAFAPQIYYVFNTSDYARVAAAGVPALRGEAFFQVPLALMIIYTIALRGAGDTRWPLLFTVIGMVFVRLPLAYLGGVVLDGGLIGAWVGMYGDMTCRAILSTVRFARGRWQTIRV